MMHLRDPIAFPSRIFSPFVPSVVLALALVGGIAVGRYADGKNGKLMAGFVPLLGSAAFLNPTPIGLIGAGFTTGVVIGCWADMLQMEWRGYNGRQMTLSGKVLRVLPGQHGTTKTLVLVNKVLSKKALKARFLMDLNFSGEDRPSNGSRIRFRALIKNTYVNRKSGKVARGQPAGDAFIVHPDFSTPLRNSRIRLETALSGRDHHVTGLLAALALGNRWEVDRSISNTMRRTGTSHLLAISGVHIGSALVLPLIFVNLFLASLGMDVIGSKRSFSIIGGGVTLSVYLSLAGASSSALRATIFVVFYWTAIMTRRYTHMFSMLGWCVAFLVCMAPVGQPDLALILSAGAVAGILVACACPCPRVLKALKVAMGAIFFTLPVSIWLAGGISVIAPICNLFVGLVFGMALIPMAVLIDLLSCWPACDLNPFVAAWVCLAGPVMSALRWFSGIPLAFIVLSKTSWFVASSSTVVAIFIWKKRRFGLFAGIMLFLAVAVIAGGFEKTVRFLGRNETILAFPSVGQADAAVFIGNGKTVLIDCAAAGRPGRMTKLEKYLVKMGVSSIDAVFLTHTHPDHTGGLQNLIERWGIKVLYIPEQEKYPDRWTEIMAMYGTKTRVISINESDEIRIGPWRFMVLGPPIEGRMEEDENARSLQLSVKWDGLTAIFTGDAAWEQVEASLEKMSSLELIKIPHHGSETGFPPEGLAATLSGLRGQAGLTAVFPCPPPGTAPLPSEKVVEWFEKQGADCLFTGRGTGVSFKTGSRTGILGLGKFRFWSTLGAGWRTFPFFTGKAQAPGLRHVQVP